MLEAACGRSDVHGERHHGQVKGCALPGKSTRNCLEPGAETTGARYRKTEADPQKLETLLLERGLAAIPRHSEDNIVLELDSTGDPLHRMAPV